MVRLQAFEERRVLRRLSLKTLENFLRERETMPGRCVPRIRDLASFPKAQSRLLKSSLESARFITERSIPSPGLRSAAILSCAAI